MLNNLGNTTVTVVRAALVVDTTDNTEYRDWANATSTVVSGCMIQPFRLSSKLQQEVNLDREFQAAFFRVWMPAGTDVQGTDRLVINGVTHDVHGIPGHWYDLEGVEDHITVLTFVRKG